jgi:hypothetical protein
MPNSRQARTLATIGLLLALAGCSARAAPSFILAGAYFPGWMLCALLAILAAIGTRTLMVVSGLASVLPFQLFVCTATGIIIATAVWLLWFGR